MKRKKPVRKISKKAAKKTTASITLIVLAAIVIAFGCGMAIWQDMEMQLRSQLESLCGNGSIDPGEQCDLGRITWYANQSYGCTPTCKVVKGWKCDTSVSPSKCHWACGDGQLDKGEVCDDGNMRNGDGCSDSCNVEDGWVCNTSSPTQCYSMCGSGLIDKGEKCDDGNGNGGDGCSSNCQIESGWSCSTSKVTPDHPIASQCFKCGDGHVDKGEQCDDGDKINGDGCSSDCKQEKGWLCSGSTCTKVCGDGKVDASGETCDDGNNINGDGCSKDCKIEKGWDCTVNAKAKTSECSRKK